MSKKESEFDRYDRMRKLEKEAEVEKRKAFADVKKKGGRPKPELMAARNWAKNYDEYYDEYE